MRKIILTLIIVLAGIGAAVAFFVFSLQRSPALPDAAFLKSLANQHPEGEVYVAELLKAREELKDGNSGNDFSATLTMAVNLNLLGEKEMALEWYQKALKQDLTNLLALNNVANLYADLGEYDKAEKTWLQLIGAYPNKPQFWRNLGYLYRYRLQKSSAEIEEFFRKGLVATDNSPDLITWLMAYFQETGNNVKWVEYANLLNAKPKE